MLARVMLDFCHALAPTGTMAIGFSGRNYNPSFILEDCGLTKEERKEKKTLKRQALFPLYFKGEGYAERDVTERSKKKYKILISTAPPPQLLPCSLHFAVFHSTLSIHSHPLPFPLRQEPQITLHHHIKEEMRGRLMEGDGGGGVGKTQGGAQERWRLEEKT